MSNENSELAQDIEDLLKFANAQRCHKCDRYTPIGYLCIHCGHDNSADDNNEEEE